MNEQSNRVSAALAGAWAALRRAFASSRPAGSLPGFESDTTLFGGLSEQPPPPAPAAKRNEFFEAGGESSYFADAEPGRKDERR